MREITEPVPERALERLSSYWLIERGQGGAEPVSTRAPTMDLARTLTVFGFRQEAEMFLHFHKERHGLKLVEIDVPELLSLLLDPVAEVQWVSLDPPPEGLHTKVLPVCFSRDGFIDFIMSRLEGRFKASAEGAS